jgi:hypothetical protein
MRSSKNGARTSSTTWGESNMFDAMDQLRNGLGNHKPRIDPLHEHWLTLHELAELIRRAGRAAGFIVESEHRVCLADSKNGKIDWVWLSSESFNPVVAFEIEGRDVAEGSVRADVNKFRECRAALNVIALFHTDHNRTPKGLPPGGSEPKERVRRLVGDCPVEIVLDEELMAPGGIERIVTRALELHK